MRVKISTQKSTKINDYSCIIQLKTQCKNTPFTAVILTKVTQTNCVQDIEEKTFKKLLRDRTLCMLLCSWIRRSPRRTSWWNNLKEEFGGFAPQGVLQYAIASHFLIHDFKIKTENQKFFSTFVAHSFSNKIWPELTPVYL